ncbi:2Fe-2S iron-sulfur cluster-binding protein [Stackebrandtia soli]|uniref:2Fe-2S iron-sulfur cluster-binding protein n=1 Tax=Stackebrandtia soli TaxID=1892856 RepID=UPI0039ECEF4D
MSPTFTVNGELVEFTPGRSIAAAAIAAGHPRFAGAGVFCGIGVCFDCRVTLNDVPGVRACLVPAAPGDVVTKEATA